MMVNDYIIVVSKKKDDQMQTEKEMAKEVAKTILNQINAIDPMGMWAWGAKNLVSTPEGLQFKTSGLVGWKGFVHVKYNYGADAYDLEFYRMRAMKKIIDKVVDGIYVDELVSTIDEQVK
jgi:hypothetical protein